jgi:hypothetical protein
MFVSMSFYFYVKMSLIFQFKKIASFSKIIFVFNFAELFARKKIKRNTHFLSIYTSMTFELKNNFQKNIQNYFFFSALNFTHH